MGFSANKVAKDVKKIIDEFWSGKCEKEEATKRIKGILDDPERRIKVMRGENYTGVFENVLGKKRIAEFEELMK